MRILPFILSSVNINKVFL